MTQYTPRRHVRKAVALNAHARQMGSTTVRYMGSMMMHQLRMRLRLPVSTLTISDQELVDASEHRLAEAAEWLATRGYAWKDVQHVLLPDELEPRHLGDGAYCEYEAPCIWLAANDHRNRVVALERDALQSLVDYARAAGWSIT